MSDWPILSTITFLPLVGAAFILHALQKEFSVCNFPSAESVDLD